MTSPQFTGTGDQWDDLLDFTSPTATTAVAPRSENGIMERQVRSVQVQVPLMRGKLPGIAKDITFDVKLAQLRRAPHALRSQYNPNDDPHLVAYAESLQSLGEPLYPLICLPTEEQMEIDGKLEDIYEVYDDIRVLYAFMVNHTPLVTILIPARQNPGEVLLKALNTHAHRQPVSLLEKADAARFLFEEYRYDQSVIAEHLGQSEEDGETPNQSYVSRLIAIAKQPAIIRTFVHQGLLTMTHVRYLAERFPGRKEEAQRILMARYVVQRKLSTKQMQGKISEIKGLEGVAPQMALIEGPDGIAEERYDQAISLPRIPKTIDQQQYWERPQRLVATPTRIKAEAKGYTVRLITHDDFEHVAVGADMLDSLRAWLDDMETQRVDEIEVSVIEAKLTGPIEAIRRAMADAHLLHIPDADFIDSK